MKIDGAFGDDVMTFDKGANGCGRLSERDQ